MTYPRGISPTISTLCLSLPKSKSHDSSVANITLNYMYFLMKI